MRPLPPDDPVAQLAASEPQREADGTNARRGVTMKSMVGAVRLLGARTAARCALCHDALGGEGHACSACAVVLHPTCWLSSGARCPTLGCEASPALARPTSPPRRSAFRVGFLLGVWLCAGAVATLAVGGKQLVAWLWLSGHRADYERLAAGVRDGSLEPIPFPGTTASWFQVDGTRARKVECRNCGVFVEVPLPRLHIAEVVDARYSLVHAPLGHLPTTDHVTGAWEKLGDRWWLVEAPRW